MKKKKENFPVTYLISQSWQQKCFHPGNIYEYACILDALPDKIACSPRKRGWRYKVVRVQCVYPRIHFLLSRIFETCFRKNIKRDCMVDLCKYFWPADKRVLVEACSERGLGEWKPRTVRERRIGKRDGGPRELVKA